MDSDSVRKAFVIVLTLAAPAIGAGPEFQHKDPFVQREFENAYKDIRARSAVLSSITETGTETCIDDPTFCVDQTNNRVGINTASPFTYDFNLTGDARITSGQIRLSDNYGILWGDTSFYAFDTGDYFRFDAGGSERVRIGTSGLAVSRGQAISSTDIDSTLEVYTDGAFSRPGINLVCKNTGHSESPVLLLENDDAPSDNGTCIAFYSTGTQQGIIGFSWVGAATTTAKMQVYLQSGGNSVPVMQLRSAGATGYAYALFGAPHIHTPGSTLHVASDSGDVDSGIRIERLAGVSRFNFFIDSSNNLILRDTDGSASTYGIKVKKTSQSVSLKGTTTNDSASTGDIGEAVESTVSAFTNVGTTNQFADITSISLTAGDWDVAGQVEFAVNTGVSMGEVAIAISTFSANTTTDHVAGKNVLKQRPAVTGANSGVSIGRYRIPLTATTTVYLKGLTTYSSGNPQYIGTITARRER